MTDSPDSTGPLIQIRCPGCAQKFKVATGLHGKMVECGNCERQFRVNDEVVVKIERVFPGEKRGAPLAQFPKVAAVVAAPVPVREIKQPSPVGGGTAVLRLLAGGIGALVIFAAGALFFIDSELNFARFPLAERFAVVAAAALIATGFFLLANRDNRLRALQFGLVGLVVLAVVPLAVPLPVAPGAVIPSGLPPAVEVRTESAEEALQKMGYSVVVRTREDERKVRGDVGAEQVMAVWLRGVREVAKVEIKDYLIRTAGADLYSHLYPRRESGEFLMVLQGTQASFTDLQLHCLRLGQLGRIFTAERTIELFVADLPFDDPGAALADPQDPAFFALNLRELESIDLPRAGRAAERLSKVEPLKFRPDIVRRLIQLLSEGDAEFKGHIAEALIVWSTDEDLAADAAMRAVQGLINNQLPVPPALITLLLNEQEPDVLPILDDFWRRDPVAWEATYAAAGPIAEDTVLESFRKTQGSLRESAVRILSRLGSPKSLPDLQAALDNPADSDLHPALKKAIAAITQKTP